jgi:acetyl/propionyl-CoA carboxylase alpha subunit
MNKINKILIANRSEIASRIIFTCKKLGIQTIAVHCKQDQYLPYVYQADENYALPQDGNQGYLDQKKIIQTALEQKADAIHPGYGFLSENATFAKNVIDAGLTWIGPSPDIITQMGDKSNAKQLMKYAGIPVIPEHHIKDTKIVFPILCKNPLGGGGKGLKKIHNITEWQKIKKQLETTNSLVEKYIEHARHIEIQIAGDGKNYIHLYERECSIQRRHQKIIEETPCNFIPKHLLENMYNAALHAAHLTKYDSIGTIEFIVTPDQQFYFLEMNTRLQVEHSITEITTGIDLIELQIHIAQTKQLPYTQEKITQSNHAIECRIYAEDPTNNFAPSSGTLHHVQLPEGPFIRHDHNLKTGQIITPFFDPMLSKITTWGKNRTSTIKHMLQALLQMNIVGIKTNLTFLTHIITSHHFLTGNIHTQLLQENNFAHYTHTVDISKQEIAIIIAALHTHISQKPTKQTTGKQTTNNWRLQQWQ